MPTLDRLASRYLKYDRFHTTALCLPTRVALLTGRNHHTNNAGAIMDVATMKGIQRFMKGTVYVRAHFNTL